MDSTLKDISGTFHNRQGGSLTTFWRRAMVVGIVASLLTATGAARAQPDSEGAKQAQDTTKEARSLTRERDAINKDLEKVQRDLDKLKGEERRYEAYLQNLQSDLKFDPENKVDGRLKELKALLPKLKDRKNYSDIEHAAGDIWTQIIRSSLNLPPEDRSPVLAEIKERMNPRPLLTDMMTNQQAELYRELKDLSDGYDKAGTVRPDRILGSDRNALESIFVAYRDHYKRYFTDYVDKLKTAIKEHEALERTLMDKLERLDGQIDTRDHLMTYAIFGIMIMVVLLFALFRSFERDVQAKIVDEHMLVEMIGLGFLLLTIVILATGDKIEKAVLGTLLGSIAGYVFGHQKSRDKASGTPAPVPRSGAPGGNKPTSKTGPGQPKPGNSDDSGTPELGSGAAGQE